jgi:hypothetical protein
VEVVSGVRTQKRIYFGIAGHREFEVSTCGKETGARVTWGHDFKLLPRCRWYLRSSGILRSVEWYLCTDVSGQLIGPIFKVQEVHDFLDFLNLEDWTDSLSQNVGTELPLYTA